MYTNTATRVSNIIRILCDWKLLWNVIAGLCKAMNTLHPGDFLENNLIIYKHIFKSYYVYKQ